MTRTPLDIIRDVFQEDVAELKDDFDLRELPNWDSLNHMNFVAAIEREYEVTLTGDEIADMLTLKTITTILAENHAVSL
ncbi:MAG: acyl carrier protein [Caulobacterales bacterium]|nr:acyl carrier protein [Caulobacterales bacterium]